MRSECRSIGKIPGRVQKGYQKCSCRDALKCEGKYIDTLLLRNQESCGEVHANPMRLDPEDDEVSSRSMHRAFGICITMCQC